MPTVNRRWRTHFASADPVMMRLVTAAGRLRLARTIEHTPFEALARAVANQQLSGLVASRILGRFEERIGGGRFPTPEQVVESPIEAMRGVGFSYAKIASLKDLAARTLEGVVPHAAELEPLHDDEIVERLTQVRGIGRWTVEMLLIFQMGRPDILPVDDFGVRNGFRLAYGLRGLPTPRALATYGERWAPFRSIATWYLWRACDLAKDGRLPERTGRPPRLRIVGKPVKARAKNTAKRQRSSR